MSHIKIFHGKDIETLEQEVNQFNKTHLVFASSQSTCCATYDDYCVVFMTIMVHYNGPKSVGQ